MSNNKQSSVDFIINLLIEKGYAGVLDEDEIEQAKAMHKEEIEDAYEQGENDGYWHPEDGWDKEFANSQQYYNEKFNN